MKLLLDTHVFIWRANELKKSQIKKNRTVPILPCNVSNNVPNSASSSKIGQVRTLATERIGKKISHVAP
jgi:hypothetical protein